MHRNRFNLLGEDSLVLAQLLFTLGVFLECSSCKTQTGERMIGSLLELSWAIRLHPEAFVRRSIFFAGEKHSPDKLDVLTLVQLVARS